ncbi:MAG: VWA domain-containing protein, partial [Flavobacteriales bacterium]
MLGLVLFLEVVLWLGLTASWIAAQAAVPSLTLHRMEQWPLLVATVLATLLALSHFHWRHKTIRQFSDPVCLESVLPPYGVFRQAWKFLLWRWALAALVVGWLDPKMGSRLEEVESEGIDMMVALDVSNSMMAEDVGMPRLDLASRTVERLMAQTAGDRIGLVVFAGESYVQCPLTTDVAAVKLFLASVSPGMVATQGTAVGSAIRTCWTGFDENSEASRTVVVLTDGENHEDDVVAAAAEVAQEGGNVHFLGLATLEGAPIPAFDARGNP